MKFAPFAINASLKVQTEFALFAITRQKEIISMIINGIKIGISRCTKLQKRLKFKNIISIPG